MKEKDIKEEYDPQQLIVYVEKEDGSYGPIQTGSYLSKNYLDDFWDKRINLEKQLSNDLISNKISPIYYYMVLCELSVAELASRVGLSKFKVKRHLQAVYFDRMRLSVLKRYAHVFNEPVANLLQLIRFEDKEDIKSHYIKKETPTDFMIDQAHTNNPNIVITTIKKIRE